MRTLLCLLVAAWPSVAVACSCGKIPLSRAVVPVSGTAGVATDVVIRVFLDGYWRPTLRERLGEEYRLRGPDDALVPLSVTVDGTMIELAPVRPLAGNARYVLERLFAYGDGDLLSDDRRWELAWQRRRADRRPEELVRVWFAEAEFTTGEGADARIPPTPLPIRPSYSTALGETSCGYGEYVGLDLDTSRGMVGGDVLGFEVEGTGVVWREPFEPWPTDAGRAPRRAALTRASTGDGGCTTNPVHIDVSRPVRVRAWAWSASGRPSLPSPWVDARPVRDFGRPPAAPPPHGGSPDPRAQANAEAFFAPPIVDATPLPGPKFCPDGLSPSTGTRRLVGYEGPVEGFVRSGDDLFLLVERGRGDRARVFAVAVSRIRRAPIPLGPAWRDYVGVDGEGAAGFVMVEEQGEGHRVALRRLRTGGSAAWSAALPMHDSHQALVTGGEHPLILWPGGSLWVVLDADTGAERGGGQLATPADGRIVGRDGSTFLLASEESGRAAGTVQIHRLDADGAIVESFPLALADVPYAMSRTETGWIAAGEAGVSWLDPAGRRLAGPWRIPEGVGTGFRDLVALGDLAVVRTENGRIVALDRTGAVSPAIDALRGRRVSGVVIGLHDGAVLAAYQEWLGPYSAHNSVIERLVCRTDRPVAAPGRIVR